MQIFGAGNKIVVSKKSVQFEDERGNLVSLHERQAIRFPDIQIAPAILEMVRVWLEQAYRQHDAQATLELQDKSQGTFWILWKRGSFNLPGYIAPLELTEVSAEMLNEQGTKCLTWLLNAVTMQAFSLSTSGTTRTWSMPKPAEREPAKGSPMFPNPLLAGRDKK